ncbi:hypothetical protein [Dokdonella sp.]|uniref:hypothetical protein n=1 Tax=Dokdonella sp. TaxID=2291710 RepID=UPI002625DE90|nr:hypothetical protein [Dokdonella sp.]
MSIRDETLRPTPWAGTSHRRNRRISVASPRRRRRPVVLEIGWLRDDAGNLAADIARACAYATLIVWIDDECRVKGTSVDSLPMMPSHWIVGTYACGASVSDIVDDLRHERHERERSWRLD